MKVKSLCCHTLYLYSTVCQLYFNKTRRKTKKMSGYNQYLGQNTQDLLEVTVEQYLHVDSQINYQLPNKIYNVLHTPSQSQMTAVCKKEATVSQRR